MITIIKLCFALMKTLEKKWQMLTIHKFNSGVIGKNKCKQGLFLTEKLVS